MVAITTKCLINMWLWHSHKSEMIRTWGLDTLLALILELISFHFLWCYSFFIDLANISHWQCISYGEFITVSFYSLANKLLHWQCISKRLTILSLFVSLFQRCVRHYKYTVRFQPSDTHTLNTSWWREYPTKAMRIIETGCQKSNQTFGSKDLASVASQRHSEL